jgi:hypothetical protein
MVLQSSGYKSQPGRKPAEGDNIDFSPSASLLLGLFFDPEEGGDISLRSTLLEPRSSAVNRQSHKKTFLIFLLRCHP